jgi:hypothetical protein
VGIYLATGGDFLLAAVTIHGSHSRHSSELRYLDRLTQLGAACNRVSSGVHTWGTRDFGRAVLVVSPPRCHPRLLMLAPHAPREPRWRAQRSPLQLLWIAERPIRRVSDSPLALTMAVMTPEGFSDPPTRRANEVELRSRLHAAFDRLLAEYAMLGGHRFHGWTTADEPRNYQGPLIWSEADCVFRFALELEKEFPRQVHCELKVNRSTRLDFPEGDEKAQQVDIAISDLSDFAAEDTAYDRFRSHQHLLFVEAKWFLKGWAGNKWEFDARDQVGGVQGDLDKLRRHVRLRRCAVAAMLVVDDEDYFETHSGHIVWPEGVERLVCGPAELRRRGLLPSATG